MGDDGVNQDESPEYLHLIRLAQYKKAISNFVDILTGKHIPVHFNVKDKNATDGEIVYLSPNIKHKKDFDVTVGLSLHEGAHIVHSDFLILKTLWQRTPRKLYDIAVTKNITKSRVTMLLKTMLNYVEDRFIDSLVYRNAPGYRGYYLALYDRYFNLEDNSAALKSKVYRFPSIDAYEFRIINFTNPATDLSALPGLEEIYNLIDIPTVLRLKTPNDRFLVAIDVCEIILKNLGVQPKSKKSNKPASSGGNPGPSNDNEPPEPESGDGIVGDENEDKDKDTDENSGGKSNKDGDKSEKEDGKPDSGEDGDSDDEDVLGGSSAGNTVADDPPSSDSENLETGEGDTSEVNVDKLKKSIERQKTFINGELKKSTLSASDSKTVTCIDRSGMVLLRVGQSLSKQSDFKGIECVFVKELTNELLEDASFPLYTVRLNSPTPHEAAVNAGVTMGRLLGKRLQIRDDVRCTKYPRQAAGKIDRRMLADLGHDVYNVFYTTKVDKFNDVYIHISVDASSSMAGAKWAKTLTGVVAICKAASMISNIKVSVSFRTTMMTVAGEIPYVVMAYDSTKDSITKVITQFKYLSPNNTTPEGLAFEAILTNLTQARAGEDRYFLNFSDGQPCFQGKVENRVLYIGEPAVEHTRLQVSDIRRLGYTVLSYFIDVDGHAEGTETLKADFKKMYGKDASFVDVNNVVKIANTMNAMFLKNHEIFKFTG